MKYDEILKMNSDSNASIPVRSSRSPTARTTESSFEGARRIQCNARQLTLRGSNVHHQEGPKRVVPPNLVFQLIDNMSISVL